VLTRLVENVKRAVAEEGDLILVYFLYDNEIYMVEDDAGELTAPIKMPGSSRYHVNGKLAMVSRDQFRAMVEVEYSAWSQTLDLWQE
jgi:hypothetical protein